LRNLSTDLFRYERIRTTLMKAKELRPFAERLITLGRRGDVHARRRVARQIHDKEVARKLVDTLSTRFAQRPGGYTRILKLGPRPAGRPLRRASRVLAIRRPRRAGSAGAPRLDDATSPRYQAHPRRRVRSDRDRTGLRVRLLRNAGVQGAPRGGVRGHPRELQ